MPVFSGQGRVLIGPRTSGGHPGALRFVGEVDPKGVSVDLKVDLFAVKESSSGQRMTLEQLVQSKDATVKFAFQEWSPKNLALQVLGVDTEVEAGTVTAEVLPSALAAGDLVTLRHPKVSSVVVNDSAGSPATLVAGTDYTIQSADYGTLEILNIGSYVQPFKADYSYAATTQIPLLNDVLRDVTVRFELINTADANKKVLVELYRVQFSPSKTLGLIQEKGIAMGEMEGALLLDPTKPADGELGQFGRVVLLD